MKKGSQGGKFACPPSRWITSQKVRSDLLGIDLEKIIKLNRYKKVKGGRGKFVTFVLTIFLSRVIFPIQKSNFLKPFNYGLSKVKPQRAE